MSKKVTIIVILVVIIIALYFAMKKPTQNNVPVPSQTASNVETATSATQTAVVVNAAPVDPAVSQIKNSGLSDNSLNQDMTAIDAQLKDFSSENSTATK